MVAKGWGMSGAAVVGLAVALALAQDPQGMLLVSTPWPYRGAAGPTTWCPATNSLLLYYGFNETGTVVDLSGRGNTGTLTGTPVWTNDGGSCHYKFPGDLTSNVRTPVGVLGSIFSCTIAFWIWCPAALTTYDYPMLCPDTLSFIGTSTTANRLWWSLHGSDSGYAFINNGWNPAGEWRHIACTWSGGDATLRIYTNGIEVTSYDGQNVCADSPNSGLTNYLSLACNAACSVDSLLIWGHTAALTGSSTNAALYTPQLLTVISNTGPNRLTEAMTLP